MCSYIRYTECRHTGGGARRGISKPFLVLLVRRLEAGALAVYTVRRSQCQGRSDTKRELLLSGTALLSI